MKIFTLADVPDDLGKAWLQHLRDFDVAHPGCHFQVLAHAPDLSFDEVMGLLKINPNLPFSASYKREKT